MLLGYADSPDAQRVVCPALDAAPVLARYPPLMNWLETALSAAGRAFPALCGCFLGPPVDATLAAGPIRALISRTRSAWPTIVACQVTKPLE